MSLRSLVLWQCLTNNCLLLLVMFKHFFESCRLHRGCVPLRWWSACVVPLSGTVRFRKSDRDTALVYCSMEHPYLLLVGSLLHEEGVVVIRTRDFGQNSGLLCASRRTDGKASCYLYPPSKNHCRFPYGECLQPQQGVAPVMSYETPTTSIQPSSGNFVVKRGLGRWRGRRRFGMGGCPMKHRCFIQVLQGPAVGE